mgnify:CR=1 FL=1
MQKQAIPKEPVASYKEVRIGKTLYRVTSVFSGEKDLGRTLEQLAVRRAMTELDAPAAAQPCQHRNRQSASLRRHPCAKMVSPVSYSCRENLREPSRRTDV